MTDVHRVGWFARMPTGSSTAYVRPAPVEDPEAVIRAAIQQECTIITITLPDGAHDFADVDDVVPLVVERDRQSRQEIERLTAVIDQVRDRIMVGGQSEAIRANWVRQVLDEAGLLTPRAAGVSDTPEATRSQIASEHEPSRPSVEAWRGPGRRWGLVHRDVEPEAGR